MNYQTEPVVLEPKSTVRYLVALVVGALLCGGVMTWMAASCTGKPPDTQTRGERLLATLSQDSGGFTFVIRNPGAETVRLQEIQVGGSVDFVFCLDNGQPYEDYDNLGVWPEAPAPKVVSLGAGESLSIRVERDVVKAARPDVQGSMWLYFRYWESPLGKVKEPDFVKGPIQSNCVAWVP